MLAHIPDLSAHTSNHSKGQVVYFMFNEVVANLVQQERLQKDYDMDAIHIVKAAEIVRYVMFHGIFSFNIHSLLV